MALYRFCRLSNIAQNTETTIAPIHRAQRAQKKPPKGHPRAASRNLIGIKTRLSHAISPYISAICKKLPNGRGKIVFDLYHLMQHINQAVDTARKQEHKALGQESLLTGTKYVWLYAHENLPPKHRLTLGELKKADLKTARAWANTKKTSAAC